MSNIEATPFGDKYVLVEHIATGGMAEIYRASYQGIEGFAKELVIKVLRDEFAAREDVVEMFLNEARVAATLTHNNVVHTYDLGDLDGEYYIAMELLKGEELVDVLRRGHQVGEGLPLDVSIGAVMQALEGLHYCHTQRGTDGGQLGLVHRDINPTNIHVGYDGVCKILDFGIAATRASALAGEGGVAGKPAYMAPEQARGLSLDGRADLFAMGVLLYEMTLGRRLFRGPRDEVMQRLLEGDIPAPTFVEPGYPPALEGIVMKALEMDPADRYQNADHFFRDLEAFLYEQRLSTSPRRLSAYMAELFGEGKPAVVDYEDEYDDLEDDALDFAAYEGLGGDEPASDSAPDWVRDIESGGEADAGEERRARMTIGSLEALVGDTPASQPSGPSEPRRERGGHPTRKGAGSGPRRRTSGRRAIPTADQTTKARRRSSGSSGAVRRRTNGHRVVATGGAGSVSSLDQGGSFGSAVVTQKQRQLAGNTVAWLISIMAIGGLAWFVYTVFTAK